MNEIKNFQLAQVDLDRELLWTTIPQNVLEKLSIALGRAEAMIAAVEDAQAEVLMAHERAEAAEGLAEDRLSVIRDKEAEIADLEFVLRGREKEIAQLEAQLKGG